MDALLQSRAYSKDEIDDSVLVRYDGPGKEKFNYKPEDWQIFLEGSNFYQLKKPIMDKYGNEFFDSEWYYMSQRTKDPKIKKAIAELSKTYGGARKARKVYDLEQDVIKRAKYMKNAIREKFNLNADLQRILLATGDKQIIEYTYWNDQNFGIDQETLTGSNILGKLLVQYREEIKDALH